MTRGACADRLPPVGDRVVVIGAGHNGLVCACRLAAAGLDVTVLEHAAAAGGATSSAEVTLPGFVHDLHAGFFPSTLASPTMRSLQLERHGLEWVSPPTPMVHPFDDGTAIELSVDLGATAASLEAAAPGCGTAWSDFVRRLHPHREALMAATFTRLPPLVAGVRLAAGMPRELFELTRRGVASADALGKELFGDDSATAWLCGSAMHAGIEPRTSPSGGFALVLHLLGHWVGWPFPRGGAGALVAALEAHLAELGGGVRTRATVERIEVAGGRATGVVLETGERVPADAVVATMSAGALAPLLPHDALPARVQRRLRTWRYAPGAFKVDFALAGPVPWRAPAARRAAVVHVGGELRDLMGATQAPNRGDVADRPALVVGQHTLFDPSRAPAGRHTLYTYAHVPSVRDVPDDDFADRMQAQIERFAPGFGELVLARAIRTPEQAQSDNPSLVGGDLSGGALEVDQAAIFRPAPELARGRTPLRGLYVAGASVHPGPAVHGASGDAAARSLLEDRAPWRVWRRA